MYPTSTDNTLTTYQCHILRCKYYGAKPLTYPQFLWTQSNAIMSTFVKQLAQRAEGVQTQGIKTFLPAFLR